MTKPPPVIEHEGYRYRRMDSVGVGPGRRAKQPRWIRGWECHRCAYCGEFLPLERFPRETKKSNGLGSWCRECKSKYTKRGKKNKAPVIIEGRRYWRCSCCEEYLLSDYFGPSKQTSSGLKSWCKRCSREDQRMRRAMQSGELGDWRERYG